MTIPFPHIVILCTQNTKHRIDFSGSKNAAWAVTRLHTRFGGHQSVQGRSCTSAIGTTQKPSSSRTPSLDQEESGGEGWGRRERGVGILTIPLWFVPLSRTTLPQTTLAQASESNERGHSPPRKGDSRHRKFTHCRSQHPSGLRRSSGG